MNLEEEFLSMVKTATNQTSVESLIYIRERLSVSWNDVVPVVSNVFVYKAADLDLGYVFLTGS